MYNYYDLEAGYPTDKASRKVLLNDYFHDSLITSVTISPERRCVEMHIQCSRECEHETGSRREDIHNVKYGYVLTFLGITYLDIKTDLTCCEYINGRFKAIPKGKYYFRIQTADGYIDIGYGGFKLRKLSGRVSYRDVDDSDLRLNREMIVPEDRISAILKRMEKDGYTEEEDFELYLDLEHLYASGATGFAEHLRRYISSRHQSEDAVPYAAWLLGKYGHREDIPLILGLMTGAYHPLIRQNLNDAIEALAAG